MGEGCGSVASRILLATQANRSIDHVPSRILLGMGFGSIAGRILLGTAEGGRDFDINHVASRILLAMGAETDEFRPFLVGFYLERVLQ